MCCHWKQQRHVYNYALSFGGDDVSSAVNTLVRAGSGPAQTRGFIKSRDDSLGARSTARRPLAVFFYEQAFASEGVFVIEAAPRAETVTRWEMYPR